ncbi:MAG: ribonuclease HII [Alphaproteobacteria bacterium]|nr:ribonuclease HII [Alphaproteobacteria bacterium]
MPDFSLEDAIDGPVCGLDEVGRGPLAGPVVAACVYIPDHVRPLPFIGEIRDSKKLSEAKLESLNTLISEHCAFAVTEITPQEIDEINILQASLKAMATSLERMSVSIRHALVDGNRCPAHMPCPATPVVKGDSVSTSIAAASIIAKAHRDRIMRALAQEHPHYGWESNVGYPSPQHLAGIDAHGITNHHRKSFAPVRNFIEFGSTKKRA